jgi:hypothetical protein
MSLLAAQFTVAKLTPSKTRKEASKSRDSEQHIQPEDLRTMTYADLTSWIQDRGFAMGAKGRKKSAHNR